MLALAVLAAILTATGQASPDLHERAYSLPDGRTVQLSGEVVGAPAVSADRRTLAFIRRLGQQSDTEPAPTEVVLMDLKTGRQRPVLRPGTGGALNGFRLRAETRVTFSLDGKRLYAEAACPCTSDEVHEIEVSTGAGHFFGWGIDISVIRDGPWRGDLLMGVHTCYRDHPGCDYPVHVVQPDGQTIFVVPGTSGADRSQAVGRWLRQHRWRAW